MIIKSIILSDGSLKTMNSKNRWENVGTFSEITSDIIKTNGFLHENLKTSITKIFLAYSKTQTLTDGAEVYESELLTQDMGAISVNDVTVGDVEMLEVTVPPFTINDSVKPTDRILSYSEDPLFRPVISDMRFDSTSTHKNAIGFTFDVTYNYDTPLKYRIKINAGEYSAWSQLQAPYLEYKGVILASKLAMGQNTISIQVANESETITTEKIEAQAINLVNGSPTIAIINGETDNFRIRFQILDPDADTIRYRILLNNTKHTNLVLADWTEFIPASTNVIHYIDTANVDVDKENQLKIEYEDEFGAVGSYVHTFTGTYKNLIFKDENNEYFVTDKGVILKILNFETMLAGSESEVKQIILKNNNTTAITNLRLNVIYTAAVEGAQALISKNANPFSGSDLIDYGTEIIPMGAEKIFYVKIDSVISAQGMCKFDIDANADVPV